VTYASEIQPTPIAVLRDSVYKVWGPVGSAGDPRVFRIPPLGPGSRREAVLQWLRNRIAPHLANLHGRRMDRILLTVPGPGDRINPRARTEVFSNVAIPDDVLAELSGTAQPADAGGDRRRARTRSDIGPSQGAHRLFTGCRYRAILWVGCSPRRLRKATETQRLTSPRAWR
jgi:hypothetical protein